MLHDAELVHRLPGRIRLKIPAGKGNADMMAALRNGLQGYAAVRSATANTTTGTLLVEFQGELAALAAYAEAHGLFRVAPSIPETTDIQASFSRSTAALSRDLKAITGGGLDFNGLLILAFSALAIQQALEGQIVVPAATALWYALNSAQRPREEVPGGAAEGRRQRT